MTKNLLFLLLLISNMSWAQTEKEVEKISVLTCECLQDKYKQLKKSDATKIQFELGICMLSASQTVGYEIDLDDPNAAEELGARVGQYLAFNCPEFMELIGKMMEDDADFVDKVTENYGSSSEASESQYTFGEVLEVSSGEFVTVKIETDTGKKETFYWMQYFEGAELLENDREEIINESVLIEFDEMEVYSPKLEDYIQIKVIRGFYLSE